MLRLPELYLLLNLLSVYFIILNCNATITNKTRPYLLFEDSFFGNLSCGGAFHMPFSEKTVCKNFNYLSQVFHPVILFEILRPHYC